MRGTAVTSPGSFGGSPRPTQRSLKGLCQHDAGMEPTTREQTTEGKPSL